MSSSFDFSKSKIPAKLQQSKSSKSAGVKELEYDDKRGESVAQLKLQDAADKSHSVNNLVDIEEQANSSNQLTQLMEIQNTSSLNDDTVQLDTGNQKQKTNGDKTKRGTLKAKGIKGRGRADAKEEEDLTVDQVPSPEKARDFLKLAEDKAAMKKILFDPKTVDFLNANTANKELNFLKGSDGLIGGANVEKLVDLYILGVKEQFGKLHEIQVYEAADGKSKEGQEDINKARQELKNENTHFKQIATEYAAFLKIDNGKALALWSGGKTLSDYAVIRKFQPLENTGLGMIFNDKDIAGNFKYFSAPLWNAISKEFVNNYMSGPVHIMLRTFEGDSVLHREEIPSLKSKEGITLKYHPIWGVGEHKNTFAEIDSSGQINSDPTSGDGFSDEGTALKLLRFAFKDISDKLNRPYRIGVALPYPLSNPIYDKKMRKEARAQAGQYGTVKIEDELNKLNSTGIKEFDEDTIELWLIVTGKSLAEKTESK